MKSFYRYFILVVFMSIQSLTYAAQNNPMIIQFINNNPYTGYAMLQNINTQQLYIIEKNGGSITVNTTVSNIIYPGFRWAIEGEPDICKNAAGDFISLDPNNYTGDEIVISMKYTPTALECTCTGSACGTEPKK